MSARDVTTDLGRVEQELARLVAETDTLRQEKAGQGDAITGLLAKNAALTESLTATSERVAELEAEGLTDLTETARKLDAAEARVTQLETALARAISASRNAVRQETSTVIERDLGVFRVPGWYCVPGCYHSETGESHHFMCFENSASLPGKDSTP